MYHSNTYQYPHKKRINKRKVVLVLLIIVVISSLLFVQRNRISLWMKGYSLSEQNVLLEVEDLSLYLNNDKIDTLSLWNRIDNNQHYYEYDQYYQLHPKKEIEEIVTFIDTYDKEYRRDMQTLGYQDMIIWDMFRSISLTDINYIREQKWSYQEIKDFLVIPSFQIEDISLYLENKIVYPKALTNVMKTSYPRIDSSDESDMIYQINAPDNLLVLVKKGFVLDKDYQPDDLVTPNIPIAPDCTSPKLCKNAALALEEMYQDAETEGYHLVINSAYRSYQEQQEIYDLYFERYDEVTASGLVALPGSSEHQTGLGVDITSQSVIDGNRLVFGDTEEKDWLFANAYKYGFIVRYPEDKADYTGTSSEPWHYRYVGKEVAKEIHDKDWILEEYIEAHGFSYTLTKQ